MIPLVLRFAVLGPLEVSLNGGPVSLGGRKQRTLLAVLLLHANEVVSRDQLIDALWGERLPPSAAESLDAYVYRLRKLLGHDRLPRERGGYMLRVEPGELDVDEFELLVASARRAAEAEDHRAAVDPLTEALALWRGPAWADMLELALASAEAQRLEELRLSALESRIEAELATGSGAELVGELEQLVSEHPLRERLLSGLMLGLYRAGRQTEALDAFRAARRRLVDEFGLEPGRELHELQQRILQHDPSLKAPRPFRPARGSRSRRTVAVGALTALAAVVVGFALSAGAANRQPTLTAGASGIVAVRVGADRVAAATPLTGPPSAVVTGSGSVWAADASNGTVSRIDPHSGVIVDRIAVGGDPASITSGDGAIWVANTVGATILRIDPATETVTQTIALGGSNPDALAFGGSRLWVADSSSRVLYEVDPSTGARLRTIPLGVSPTAIVFGAGALWVADYNSAAVLKISPSSGRVMGTVRVATGAASLAFAVGDLWVANSLASTVSRIDPATLTVRATIPVGSGPSAVIAAGGSVWVANQYSRSVSRIDPRRDAVSATVAVGGMPTSLTAGGGRLWLGVDGSGARNRGGRLVIASVATFPSVDPAFFNSTEPPAFGGLAYDTLVTFDHTGGVDGLRLVPDLALTLPTPTDRGRTYAFWLRPGIRYSNGTAVRAGDFRRAIERLFRAGSPGTDFYPAIVGAVGCVARPKSCDLARGIVTNDAAHTVVFHLTTPDPAFLYKLTEQDYTAPVPPGTPNHNTALHAIPGTGPYRIARADRTGVYFARNAFFREWSHAAQPNGHPNLIAWRYLRSQHDAASAVQHGQADWFDGLIPLSDYHQLAIQSAAQLHTHPLFAVEFFAINTHLAPFDNVLAREALNYAINRRAIAQMYGGPAFATPTCQPLAPGLPGYRRYCPYTSHPSPTGAYTGPDVTHAKRLVTQSGTHGEHVTVWGSPDEGYIPPDVAAYTAGVLRSLGYRTTLHLVPNASITKTMYPRFQLSTTGDWLADYPDPSSYLPPFFSCNGSDSNGYACDPALDRKMRKAASLELDAPAAANTLWTSIDHTLTNRADWVPTVNVREVDLVSQRLGNYQFNPAWGFLVDQSWVR
ncbi:MAG: ABC transporter substrate-binding protein [Solirubrobacteraceae bacterium]